MKVLFPFSLLSFAGSLHLKALYTKKMVARHSDKVLCVPSLTFLAGPIRNDLLNLPHSTHYAVYVLRWTFSEV